MWGKGGMGCGGKGGKNKNKGGAAKGEPPHKKFAAQGADGGPSANTTMIAEVRFDNPKHAQTALGLDGSMLSGGVISVMLDTHSKDGSKIIVTGVPRGAEWQEVKDHFGQCGQVAFANVKSNTPLVGTVRYETPEEANNAVAIFNGIMMDSGAASGNIEVKLHGGSSDKTKVQIYGLPAGTEWQELKDFFGQAGKVIFAEVVTSKSDSGYGLTGEIRYDDPTHAMQAINLLNGSKLGGAQISVIADPQSQDGSKLIVKGIPAGIEWQELKDHFSPIGTVAFSQVNGGKGKGKGKKGGFGDMMGMNMNQMMKGMGGMGGMPMMVMMGGKGGMMPMMGGWGGGGGFGGGGKKGGKQPTFWMPVW